MKSTSIILCIALGLVLGACGKSGSSGSSKKEGAKPATKTMALGNLGLKAELPEAANVGKGIGGDGVLVQATDLVVSVEEASKSRPKTLEEAKKNAEMYGPKNIKTEKLSDGWVFTFENKGGLGTNYFVQVRRDIGGKAYWCSTTASRPAQRENAVKFCKGLKQ